MEDKKNNLTIDERLEKIKGEVEKIKIEVVKKKLIKELLTETDFILTKTALYPYEDEVSKKESNYLKKFLEYKIDVNPLFKGMDCDVNLYNMILYCQLNEKLKIEDIQNQNRYTEKYEIVNNIGCYRGDTLTSAQTIIKKYLVQRWLKIDEVFKDIDDLKSAVKEYMENKGEVVRDKELLDKINTFKSIDTLDVNIINFYKLFLGESSKGFLYEPFNTPKSEIYYLENSDIIWNVLDEPVKEFLRVYQMFGNYMCIPGKEGFNGVRSNFGEFDTVDTLLVNLYGYMSKEDESYLECLLGGNKKIIKETKQWLKSIYENNWFLFVEKNCLYAFVTSKDKGYIPISMKIGKPIENIEQYLENKYNPQPTSYEEFLVFFEQLSKRIVWRTIDIYKAVRK